MKEMLKNKVMMLFMCVLLGTIFINSYETKKMEENVDKTVKNVITMNIK